MNYFTTVTKAKKHLTQLHQVIIRTFCVTVHKQIPNSFIHKLFYIKIIRFTTNDAANNKYALLCSSLITYSHSFFLFLKGRKMTMLLILSLTFQECGRLWTQPQHIKWFPYKSGCVISRYLTTKKPRNIRQGFNLRNLCNGAGNIKTKICYPILHFLYWKHLVYDNVNVVHLNHHCSVLTTN
jgi:hypothetical protein